MADLFFRAERYAALIAALGRAVAAGEPDAAEDLEYVEGHMRNFLAYVSAVGTSEIGIGAAEAALTGEALRTRVTELDRERSRNHDAAIASASALNRIAAAYGVGPIYTGDPALRRQVAAFCMEVTAHLFANRR